MAMSKGQDIQPKLLVPYALACLERRDAFGKYADRLAFLRIWNSSKDDIHCFSVRQAAKWKKITGDLRAALPRLDSDSPLDSIKGMVKDLMDALPKDENTQEVNEEVVEIDEEMVTEEARELAAGIDQEDSNMKKFFDETQEMNELELEFLYLPDPEKIGEKGDEQESRAQYQDWVDKTLMLCLEEADKVLTVEEEARDPKQVALLLGKMMGLSQDQELRKECQRLGFTEF